MATGAASTVFVSASSQYMYGDNTARTSGGAMSVAGWFNLTASTNGYLFGLFDDNDDERYYNILYQATGTLVSSVARYDTSPWLSTSSTLPSTDTWYFIVGNYFAASGDNCRKVYLNAVEKGTGPTNLAALPDGNFIRQGVGALTRITPSSYADAKICDPQAYDQTLSIAEQQEIMYNPSAKPGELVWWLNMRAPSGAAANYVDLSGVGAGMDSGTLPSVSSDGPPIHLFPGGM